MVRGNVLREHVCFRVRWWAAPRSTTIKSHYTVWTFVKVNVECDAVIEGETRPCGNGSHVLVPKKYLGRKVKILVMEE